MISDEELITQAKTLVRALPVRGGTLSEVGCVLITENGERFSGACMDLACGIGFCAEHAAIAQMITHTDETHIAVIVAANDQGAIPPCGRCRELMNLIDERNLDTRIILSPTESKTLRELLPTPWSVS
jgi:cytidine deaminase